MTTALDSVRYGFGIAGEEVANYVDALEDRVSKDSDLINQLREQLAKLTQELETERMRLAACGVVAMANTPESAVEAREMHPDYMSASCQDVMRAVDAEMKYREQLAAAEEGAARYRYLRNCTVTDGDVDESLYVSVDSDDWPNRWALFGRDLDKAIDAAMKGEEA